MEDRHDWVSYMIKEVININRTIKKMADKKKVLRMKFVRINLSHLFQWIVSLFGRSGSGPPVH